jgi:hypothetical protein
MEAFTGTFLMFTFISWMAGAGYTAFKTWEFHYYGFPYGKRLGFSAAVLLVFFFIPFVPLLPLLFWFMSEEQKAVKARKQQMKEWATPDPSKRSQDTTDSYHQAPVQPQQGLQWTPQQLALLNQWADGQAYWNIWTPQQLDWFQRWSNLYLTNYPAFQQSENVFQNTDPIVYGQVLVFVQPTLSAPTTPQWGPGSPIPSNVANPPVPVNPSVPMNPPVPANPPAPTAQPAQPAPAAPANPSTGQVNVTKTAANPATGTSFTAPN